MPNLLSYQAQWNSYWGNLESSDFTAKSDTKDRIVRGITKGIECLGFLEDMVVGSNWRQVTLRLVEEND